MTRADAAPNKLFYGWIVVAIAFVTMGVAISARSSFSLLFPEMLREFGWERGLTAGSFSVGFIASTAILPLIGFLMDRFGPRVVIPLGAISVAGGFVMLTQISTPAGLYAAMGLLIVNGSMAMSFIVHSMFLPNWFVRNRGFAIGVAFSGVGIGGIVLLPMMQYVIDEHGWRTTCYALAALVVVAIIPLNAIFQRNRPADKGLQPDGIKVDEPASARPYDVVVDKAWAQTDWKLSNAARTGRFWWVFGSFFCALFVWYAVQVHQTKFLIEIGFDTTFAATALGLVTFFGIAGQVGIGAFSDRYGREIAWTVSLLGFFATSILLVALQDTPTLTLVYAMVAVQGLFGYGLATLFGAVITEIFSGRQLASIFAMISLGGNLGAAAGAWGLGALHDAFGNYIAGFWVCAAASLLSIFAMWAASPRKVRRVAGQARKMHTASDAN